jgi:CheY-like chemotaxis protein
MARKRILIVEDDDLHYELYQEALEDYELSRSTTASAALARLPKERPDLILLDHVLARREKGLAYLPEFKDLPPYVPIIVPRWKSPQIGALTGPRRAHYRLTGPVDLNELRRAVATASDSAGGRMSQFEAPGNDPARGHRDCSAWSTTACAGRPRFGSARFRASPNIRAGPPVSGRAATIIGTVRADTSWEPGGGLSPVRGGRGGPRSEAEAADGPAPADGGSSP